MNRPGVILAALALAGPTWAAESPSSEAAARQALAQQYRKWDDANQGTDLKSLLAVLGTINAPGFVARDASGKSISPDKWLTKLQTDATLGGRVRSNSGGFRIVDSQKVSYETVIDKLSVLKQTATVEVRRRRLVGTVGRRTPGGPRQMTGEVWTETDRDGWLRTPQGWRLQTTQALRMSVISSIAFVDPPPSKP